MQEDKLREVILKELQSPDRAIGSNELIFRIWRKMGWNFFDADHRQEMPQCETITRIARDLKLEFPALKGSQKEQERRGELQQEYKLKYGGRANETLENMKR